MMKKLNRRLNGSFTVEASIVVSTMLLVIALLLQGVFTIHSRVVGKLILAEAMEEIYYRERPLGGILKEDPSDITEFHNNRLKGYFYCGDCAITVKNSIAAMMGTFKKADGQGSNSKNMTIIKEDPEQIIWMFETFLGDRKKTGENADGNRIQKGNES